MLEPTLIKPTQQGKASQCGRSIAQLLEGSFSKNPADAYRQLVLLDTLALFEKNVGYYRTHAEMNHKKWRQSQPNPKQSTAAYVEVVEGDWGEVTLEYTKKNNGTIFAVLNMANAQKPGGGYVEGRAAQEENMWRRSNCHFTITDQHTIPTNREEYSLEMQNLINGNNGFVYFDEKPRICIKGKELNQNNQLSGYSLLEEGDHFFFYELRSAAINLKNVKPQTYRLDDLREKTRAKIIAQLETLMANNQQHVILSAFGCGAFENDPHMIAQLYREEIAKRAAHFKCIVFAIYNPGYGKTDNYTIFKKILVNEPVQLVVDREVRNLVLPTKVFKTTQSLLLHFNSQSDADFFYKTNNLQTMTISSKQHFFQGTTDQLVVELLPPPTITLESLYHQLRKNDVYLSALLPEDFDKIALANEKNTTFFHPPQSTKPKNSTPSISDEVGTNLKFL